MKDLYKCIFKKFNLSLQEINLFDYNRQDEVITNKLQQAFLYYKTHSRDAKIMFMQFCRNLQKVAEEFSMELNRRGDVKETKIYTKSYVFINIHNLSIMLLQNKQEKIYSFICIQSISDVLALNEYASIMRKTYNIDIEKERCTFFGSSHIVSGHSEATECITVFYQLKAGEFRLLENVSDDTIFKNINDPILVLSSNFIYISPFMKSINQYIKDVNNIITRKKSESAPVKPVNLPVEVLSDEEKSELTGRLKEFEKGLDDILKKYNLLK